MATMTLIKNNLVATAKPFPRDEIERRLREELKKIADEAALIRPEWEPLLDSKRVVGTVLLIEDLFPFRIPPDKVVRTGGYNSVDEAITDMLDRIRKIWSERSKAKVRK